MRCKTILFIAAIFMAFACSPAPQKPALAFGEDGSFTIMQLTDLHMVSGEQEDLQQTISRVKNMVESERPDFIMITGDVVFGSPAEPAIRTFLETLEEYELPYACFYGNHDMEQDLVNPEMTAIYTSYPHCLNTARKDSTLADEKFKIMAHDGVKEMYDIYGIDSHDYAQVKGVGTYAWITEEQIAWLKAGSREATVKNGGDPVPSLMFCHIPLIEIGIAAEADTSLLGTFNESVCSPKLNSGVFAALKECGGFQGAFFGHDHDNDFITSYYGVALGYGKYSGGACVYNNTGRGCRMFRLQEGEKGFTTWIRMEDGEILDKVHVEDGVIARQ